MAIECQNCGDELPFDPERAVEDGGLEEFVAHTFNPDDVAVSETAFYCNPDCFIEAKS